MPTPPPPLGEEEIGDTSHTSWSAFTITEEEEEGHLPNVVVSHAENEEHVPTTTTEKSVDFDCPPPQARAPSAAAAADADASSSQLSVSFHKSVELGPPLQQPGAEDLGNSREIKNDDDDDVLVRPRSKRFSWTQHSSPMRGSRSSSRRLSYMSQSVLNLNTGLGTLPLTCILINYISAGYILLPAGKLVVQ